MMTTTLSFRIISTSQQKNAATDWIQCSRNAVQDECISIPWKDNDNKKTQPTSLTLEFRLQVPLNRPSARIGTAFDGCGDGCEHVRSVFFADSASVLLLSSSQNGGSSADRRRRRDRLDEEDNDVEEKPTEQRQPPQQQPRRFHVSSKNRQSRAHIAPAVAELLRWSTVADINAALTEFLNPRLHVTCLVPPDNNQQQQQQKPTEFEVLAPLQLTRSAAATLEFRCAVELPVQIESSVFFTTARIVLQDIPSLSRVVKSNNNNSASTKSKNSSSSTAVNALKDEAVLYDPSGETADKRIVAELHRALAVDVAACLPSGSEVLFVCAPIEVLI